MEAATFKGDDDKKNITKPDWNKDDKNITKPIWDDKKNITKPTKPAKPFTSMVQKIIAANETTATVTVAEINGEANKGIPKIATFGAKANLKTISSAAASKFSWATVSFNAAVSDTSFTVTIPADTKKNTAWVVVSAACMLRVLLLGVKTERIANHAARACMMCTKCVHAEVTQCGVVET